MVTYIFWWRSPQQRSRCSPRPRSRWSYHGSWWWVGHQTWYPPSIVSPENESFSRGVKVATKSQSKAVPKTRPSLCSSVKSTGQFLHLFEHQQQTNKKTSKLHCFCPRFHFSLYFYADRSWPVVCLFCTQTNRWKKTKRAQETILVALSKDPPTVYIRSTMFFCFLDRLFVCLFRSWGKKRVHRSPPAVLCHAAVAAGQRRDVLARHWEDGQPATSPWWQRQRGPPS